MRLGLAVAAVGWVVLVVGVVLTVAAWWPLIPAGAVTVAAGLLVDFEPEEAVDGKRH